MGDTWKLIFTYAIAAIIIIGGGAALIFIPDVDDQTQLFIAGTVGAAVQYVFNREVATQATRAAQSSADLGSTISAPTIR